MSELLPCPFCGSGHAALAYSGQPAFEMHVTCVNCNARGSSEYRGSASGIMNGEETTRKAIEAWNTRNEWIPIKEQWPPTDGYYVVWFQDQTSTLKLEDGNWYWGNMDVMDEEDQEYVTHWQPIRAPKGE